MMFFLKWVCLLGFLLTSGFNSKLQGQKVCGAEIEKDYYFPETKKLFVRVQVCRQGAQKDTILFDWGDGQIEPFVRIFTIDAGNGYLIDRYNGTHYYAEELDGYVELKILGEEIMEGYANVDYSQSTAFTLSDSMLVFSLASSPVLEYTYNRGPDMTVMSIVNYGTLDYLDDLLMYYLPIDPDTLDYQAGAFPVAGYEPPGGPEEFYMVGGLLYWESPLEPGLYAAACKISEMRFTNNPIYPPDQMTMVSTITRAFTILVDSAGLATSLPSLEPTKIVSVYPNPASAQFTVAVSGLGVPESLHVFSADGRLMHQRQWPNGGVQEQSVRVDDWPTGMYLLELETQIGVLHKKILIE